MKKISIRLLVLLLSSPRIKHLRIFHLINPLKSSLFPVGFHVSNSGGSGGIEEADPGFVLFPSSVGILWFFLKIFFFFFFSSLKSVLAINLETN